MDKVKILFLPSDRFGVGMHRSVMPAVNLDRYYRDLFDVQIEYEPYKHPIEWFDNFDIVHFSKNIGNTFEQSSAILDHLKEKGKVAIMDIDDYWNLGTFHPMGKMMQKGEVARLLVDNLRRANYVTTTTSIFADKIKQHNPNVYVFPNAADLNDPQFISKPTFSNRIRFGIICGSSHEHDIELLRGVTNSLEKDVLNKSQFVLCGFDLKGSMKMRNKETGEITERPILPTESVWYRYEKVLTNDYKLVSPEYKHFLAQFLPNSDWPLVEAEMYRRCWTKDIRTYMTHYNNIDVLLAPLKECEFNKMKSNLKTVEAGVMNKGLIAEDYGPYQIDTINIINKDGSINKEGNCMLVEPRKNHKQWAKYITKLVKDPSLIEIMSENLHKLVVEKYDIKVITDQRKDFYLDVYQKSKIKNN